MTEPSVLAWRVAVAQIPADGLDLAFVAKPNERAALAAACGLVEVRALALSATVRRDGKGRVWVDGRVAADIVQTCVVTLTAVDQRIDEPLSLRFVGRDSPQRRRPRPGAEVVVKPDAPDPPEILTGPWLDLGAVAEEHLALAIDP